VLKANGGYALELEKLGRLDSPMASDDLVIPVDEDGIVEAEGADTRGDLADLLVRMRARVARIGLERGDRAHLHRQPFESYAI
jgi:hypothetical protein